MIRLTDPARISTLAAKLQQAGAGWHLPLVRAALAGDLGFLLVPPGERVPLRMLDPVKHPLPLVVVLCGDGDQPAGPDAFPQARRLLRWSRAIMLHGAGGEERHYVAAVDAARMVRRVLIADSTSADLPAWVALSRAVAPATSTLVIATRPGASHPRETAPAGAVVQ